MNRKQLALLFLALAVLGGASLLLLNRKDESWSSPQSKMGQKLFPNLAVNDVAGIHIQGAGDLHLEYTNGSWKVRERGGYPADFSQIKETILKLADLKIAQSDLIGPSQLAHMQLMPPGKGPDSGTLVELTDAKGKVMQSMLLGKKSMEKAPAQYGGGDYPNGCYVMLGGDTQDVFLISDALANLPPDVEPWLNKDFFKIEKPSAISFQAENPTNSWKITRESETAPWVLANAATNEIMDSNKVSSLSSTLTYPSFVDVASNTSPAATGLDHPMGLSIQTFEHFNYDLKIGRKTNDDNLSLSVAVTADLPSARVPGKDEKPEDKTKLDQEFQANLKKWQDKLAQEKTLAPWVYVVNASLLDPLLRNRADLMVEKKEAAPLDSTNTVPSLAPADIMPGEQGK